MPVATKTARGAKGKKKRAKTLVDEVAELRSLPPKARIERLSPAELEVVRGMVEGLSPKEVSQERGTSIATVRTQLKRAKKKTAARTLNELVALVCLAEIDPNLKKSN